MRRYQDSMIMTGVKKIDSDGKESTVRRLSTVMYPDFFTGNDTKIISQDGDRLDILAKEFYDDERLWFVIARANDLGKGTMAIPSGQIIYIQYETNVGVSERLTEFNRSR